MMFRGRVRHLHFVGVGGVGRYWVQNFAGGGDYTGNLDNLDDF